VTCNGGATRWWATPLSLPGHLCPGRRVRANSALGEINHDGKRTLIVMGRPVPRSHRRVTGNGPPYPPSLIDAPISVTRNGPPHPPSTPLGEILMMPDSAQKSRPIDPVFRADSVVLAISVEKDGNCGWSTPGSDAAKVVLLGEVLKLRWRGPTPPLRVTWG
jgi:hypothetical protein